MNPEQRKERIKELKMKIEPLRIELNVLIKNCGSDESPHQIIRKRDSAYCNICDTYHGWWCPDSSNGVCDYYDIENNIYDEDSCIYCGNPEERK